MLELDHRRRRFAAEIFDRILVAEPVRPFDGVVHVPLPVIRPHVAEARSDAALRRDGVAARREDLGDAGRLQSGSGGAHGRGKTSASSTDNHHVIAVVDNLVSCAHAMAPKVIRASANSAIAAPATARNNSRMLQANRLPSSWT